MALAEEVFAQHPDADRVILFGELCGGKYPHKNVRTDEPREKTQPVLEWSYTRHSVVPTDRMKSPPWQASSEKVSPGPVSVRFQGQASGPKGLSLLLTTTWIQS